MADKYELSYTAEQVNEGLSKAFNAILCTKQEFTENQKAQVRENIGAADAQLATEIAVERARIDTFTALGEGSTTGDAELMDVRVGYDGSTYGNAGDAVRGQVGELHTSIDELGDNISNIIQLGESHIIKSINRYNSALNRGEFLYNASFRADGTISAGYSRSFFTTPYIAVEPNTTYTVIMYQYDANHVLWCYDSELNPIEKAEYITNYYVEGISAMTFTTSSNAKYIVICCSKYVYGMKANGDENDTLECLVNNFQSNFMLAYGTEYPREYIPYSETTQARGTALKPKVVGVEQLSDELVEIINGIIDEPSGVNIPDYYEAEVADCITKLETEKLDNFNVLCISDIHYWDVYTEFPLSKLKIIIESVKRIAENSRIDAVLYLGDSIEGGGLKMTKENAYEHHRIVTNEFKRIGIPVYFAKGNHDNNEFDYATTSNYPNGHSIDHYITDDEWVRDCWGDGIRSYYKVDFDEKEVRLIIVNSSDFVETVAQDGTLIRDVETDAYNITSKQYDKIAEWISRSPYKNIVVASHVPHVNLSALLKKVNDGEDYVDSKGGTIEFNNNKVIAYLAGDTHNAALEFNETYNVPISVVSCASLATNQQNGYVAPSWITSWEDAVGGRTYPRVAGEISETSFDILSINENRIKKIKFGAGVDGEITY